MHPTLAARRDRAGHTLRAAAGALAALLCLPAAVLAEGPGKYTAPRFDVAARVLPGGDLDVTESITFEFQSGTFRRVWREIPAARTDGIEILEASLDGTPLPPGDGPGHVTVSGRQRVRIEWQFEPVGPSTHLFQLHYRARGVAYRVGDRDVVRWRLLPAEHRYTIGVSRSTITGPDERVAALPVETRRIDDISQDLSGGSLTVLASGVRSNGWAIAELRYPASRLIAGPPQWRQRQERALALAPRWITIGAVIFGGAILLLLGIRQGYVPPAMGREEATTTEPPEPLPAALAAVLAARGRTSGNLGIATLLDLADRGVITVRELPKTLGSRGYELSQVPGTHELEDHETEALAIAFGGRGDDVSLSRARGRLTRGGRRFAATVNGDLARRGYLDPERKAARDRLTVVSIAMLIAGALGSVAAATQIPRFEAWPFLLPLGLFLAGIVGIVMAASTTALSDEGLMQSARWRGFKRFLKSVADVKESGGPSVRPRWVVYGIAVGLAPQWAKYLKAHPGAAPPWFVPLARDDKGAFAAFVGSNAAAAGGHGGAGGGGAAGGGGSGAG